MNERLKIELMILCASLLLVPPVSVLARWIQVSTRVTSGHENRLVEFLSVYPIALQNPTLISIVALAFSMAAATIALFAFGKTNGFQRFMAFSVSSLGGMMSAWLLFSLM